MKCTFKKGVNVTEQSDAVHLQIYQWKAERTLTFY